MMMKKPNMKIQVDACPTVDKVLIKNLRENVSGEEVALYFEDQRNCPCGGDVVHVEMYDNVAAIIHFQDSAGAC